jgi:hypothetical protein
MPNVVQCPGCNKRLQAADEVVGLELKCPECGRVFGGASSAVQASPPAFREPAPVSPPLSDVNNSLVDRGTNAPMPNASGSRLEDFDFTRMPPVVRPLAGFGRAVAACVLMGVIVCLEAADTLANVLVLRDLNAPDPVPVVELDTLAEIQEFTGRVAGPTHLVAVVVFLIWFYSAYANLRALGVWGLHYSPGWAVAYWFIPFLNLVRPIQIAQEIWRASDPNAPVEYSDAWRRRRGSVRAGFWWACWLLYNLLGAMSSYSTRRPDLNIDQLRIGTTMAILASLFSIAASILVISLIQAINRRQFARFDRLLAYETAASPD